MHLEDFRGHIRWEEGSQTPLTLNFSFKEKKQNDNWVGGGGSLYGKNISV